MPITEACGLNQFYLQSGSALLGAYVQLHVSRTEFFVLMHEKLYLSETDTIKVFISGIQL